ncbi:MAG: hypothetical protein DRP42_06725 [Tenericutes bacterium]|nr:MAG: hypothetical protein DRP42_06725 [Mycoplasmatota bacterium]
MIDVTELNLKNEEDLDFVMECWHKDCVYHSQFDPELYKDYLEVGKSHKKFIQENPFKFFSLEVNRQRVGDIGVVVKDNVLWINDMFVFEGYRGKGYGKYLVLYVILNLNWRGKPVKVKAHYKNLRTIKFYKSFGFMDVLPTNPVKK